MNSPKEIANNYIAIGKGKVNTPVAKMFVLGILAGIFYSHFGGSCFLLQPLYLFRWHL